MGGDLTQVLRRPVELATQSGHWNRILHGLFAMSAYDPTETLAAASALDAVSSPFK